jgi:hypothetical protein
MQIRRRSPIGGHTLHPIPIPLTQKLLYEAVNSRRHASGDALAAANTRALPRGATYTDALRWVWRLGRFHATGTRAVCDFGTDYPGLIKSRCGVLISTYTTPEGYKMFWVRAV